MAHVTWDGTPVYDAGPLREHPEYLSDLGKNFRTDGWMWCLHCEQAYPVGDVRVVKGTEDPTYFELECPVASCDGTPLDWQPWTARMLPRAANPNYPDVPEAYKEYPLYGPEARPPTVEDAEDIDADEPLLVNMSRVVADPGGRATSFVVPSCEACGSTLLITSLLEDPDMEMRDIDFQIWSCLQCEEDGGYDYSMEEQDEFRRNVQLLRQLARGARLP